MISQRDIISNRFSTQSRLIMKAAAVVTTALVLCGCGKMETSNSASSPAQVTGLSSAAPASDVVSVCTHVWTCANARNDFITVREVVYSFSEQSRKWAVVEDTDIVNHGVYVDPAGRTYSVSMCKFAPLETNKNCPANAQFN